MLLIKINFILEFNILCKLSSLIFFFKRQDESYQILKADNEANVTNLKEQVNLIRAVKNTSTVNIC